MNKLKSVNGRKVGYVEGGGYQPRFGGEGHADFDNPPVQSINMTEDAKQHERIYSEPYDYHGFDWIYIGCSCGLISIWQAYTKIEWRCPNDR